MKLFSPNLQTEMKGGVQGHGFIVQGVAETPSFCFSTFPTSAVSAEGIERAA